MICKRLLTQSITATRRAFRHGAYAPLPAPWQVASQAACGAGAIVFGQQCFDVFALDVLLARAGALPQVTSDATFMHRLRALEAMPLG
ncbi:hypothetical protein O987_12185 [Comamonas testosteroni TK102]|uniref:Uncharacterized protein n=1 Tax=Comamonas testosteroni TK102 TaxID=1392005 RepID=A0A076PLI8_COMTE|nr:hypothetical protein O987_12185 [Comamonas testosteroni TK102]